MFNLLVFNVDWKSGKVRIPVARMFEYTDEHITQQFQHEKSLQLDHLISLPCLFCEEGTGNEIARVGQITQARPSGLQLSLEISFDTDVPPLRNSMLYANHVELGMPHTFELSRNHWAVKEVDLYRFLLRIVRPRRQHPTVFQIPEHESIGHTLASAMMPFGAELNAVYESIRQAVGNVGLECKRADDFWEHAAIIQDVVSLIDRSRIVICDCTGRNPNVFYEAGIAHTLGRDVILITQNEHDIPFDLRHLRYIRYLNNAEGRAALTQALEARMQTLLEG